MREFLDGLAWLSARCKFSTSRQAPTADLAPGSRDALAMDCPDRLVGRLLPRSTFGLALHLQAGFQDGTSRALPPGVAELL